MNQPRIPRELGASERLPEEPAQRGLLPRIDDLGVETLAAAQQGDVDAYHLLVTAWQRPVLHMVFRLVGGRYPEDVEDIAQDVFVKLFKSLPTFDPGRGTKLSSWVFTFVKNYCLDVLKRKRLPIVSMEGHGRNRTERLEIPGSERRPHDEVAGREIQRSIARAVELLPTDQRIAFILREYEGLPYSQIAEITETTEGTVKSRIHRAKEALRYRLRGRVFDDHDAVQ